jgi:hypothetical protein
VLDEPERRRELMRERNVVTRLLLVLYAVGTVVIAVPLAFALPGTGELASTTSGKVLAAALLALGLGALRASRDPWRDRLMVQVLIVFTGLSALAIAYRILFEGHALLPAGILLMLAVATPVVLVVFYPRPPAE